MAAKIGLDEARAVYKALAFYRYLNISKICFHVYKTDNKKFYDRCRYIVEKYEKAGLIHANRLNKETEFCVDVFVTPQSAAQTAFGKRK